MFCFLEFGEGFRQREGLGGGEGFRVRGGVWRGFEGSGIRKVFGEVFRVQGLGQGLGRG